MKVLLADDHRLMLDGIRRALEDDGGFEIVGETQNGAQVLPLVGQTSPDLVVLDVRMPNMDGLQCLEEIRRRHPKVKVVMLSASTTPDLIEEALRRGASAYVLKTVDPSDLPSTLRQVIGGTVFSTVGATETSTPSGAKAAGLTDREVAILTELASGKSNDEIAKELWVTQQTVKFHLTNVYRKLGAKNRADAVRQAYQLGLIQRPSATTDDYARSSGGRGRPEVEAPAPSRHAPLACATRITAPTIVVGTNQTACMQIANASPASRPMPKSASADDAEPLVRADEARGRRDRDAEVERGRDEDRVDERELDADRATDEDRAPTAQVDQAATLIPNQTRPRSTESGSERPSSVSRRNRRGSPRCTPPRPRPPTRVRARGRRGAPSTASTRTEPTTIRSTQPSSVTKGRLTSRNATSARMSKPRSSTTVARPRPYGVRAARHPARPEEVPDAPRKHVVHRDARDDHLDEPALREARCPRSCASAPPGASTRRPCTQPPRGAARP